MNPISSRVELLRAVSAGFAPTFVFFWKAESKHGARGNVALGPECLSQWYPASFVVEGVRYTTAEHFMMAEKARISGDEAARRRILAAVHPGEAKELGREIQGFREAVWCEARYDVVRRGNLSKFGQSVTLRDFLLSTGGAILAEASPKDTIWGIGLSEEDSRAREPGAWRGMNLLGFVLMSVRECFQNA